MPTFDFTCTACKSVFEKTLSFGVKTKPACPKCGSKKTEKMLSMPGVVFKGSGFYKTDSKASTVKKNPEAVKTEPASSEPQPDLSAEAPRGAKAEPETKKSEPTKKTETTKP